MITLTKKSCIVCIAICLLKNVYAFNTTIPQQNENYESVGAGESSTENVGIDDKRNTGSNSIKHKRDTSSRINSDMSDSTTTSSSNRTQQQTDYYTHYYSNKQEILNTKYDESSTYLDLFGERAKQLLTQHIIPSTDAECKWDWRMGRCEPYCKCSYNFLAGDYHLGRKVRFCIVSYHVHLCDFVTQMY